MRYFSYLDHYIGKMRLKSDLACMSVSLKPILICMHKKHEIVKLYSYR